MPRVFILIYGSEQMTEFIKFKPDVVPRVFSYFGLCDITLQCLLCANLFQWRLTFLFRLYKDNRTLIVLSTEVLLVFSEVLFVWQIFLGRELQMVNFLLYYRLQIHFSEMFLCMAQIWWEEHSRWQIYQFSAIWWWGNCMLNPCYGLQPSQQIAV